MIQVIDGRAYNTETATKLAERECWVGGAGDFRSWCEGLYRTAKGAYGLPGEGGALTSWASAVGGSGEGLRALTADEAREWLEAGGSECCAVLIEHFDIEEA